MDYLQKQKRLELMYKIGCFLMGVLSDFLFFYVAIGIDDLINTFEESSLHIIYIPILFSLLIIYLECKFLSECVKPNSLFIVGSIFGLMHIFDLTFKIPNYNLFYVDDYIAYNLIRYFSPVVVFVMANVINFLIRRLIYIYRCYMANNYYKIYQYIEEHKNDIIEDSISSSNEELEPQGFLDMSHKYIGKLSDIIGKSIDPDYEREDKNKRDL